MKLERFNTLFKTLTILALLVFVGSFIVSSLLTQGAVLAQRIEPSQASSFFADNEAGTPIGSPQLIVVRDEQAFLEGTSKEGARLINEKYLRQNNIYPLQVKTVEFFRNIAALIAGLAVVVFGWLWSRTEKRNTVQVTKQ